MEPMDIKDRAKLKSMQINNALGLFILFFGVVVVAAIPFSDNSFDKVTNLVAGVVLVIIGLGMVIYAKKTIKGLEKRK
jgi:cytosine/uracil/thiamine/allantoin permease